MHYSRALKREQHRRKQQQHCCRMMEVVVDGEAYVRHGLQKVETYEPPPTTSRRFLDRQHLHGGQPAACEVASLCLCGSVCMYPSISVCLSICLYIYMSAACCVSVCVSVYVRCKRMCCVSVCLCPSTSIMQHADRIPDQLAVSPIPTVPSS